MKIYLLIAIIILAIGSCSSREVIRSEEKRQEILITRAVEQDHSPTQRNIDPDAHLELIILDGTETFDLSQLIQYTLEHNPLLKSSDKNVKALLYVESQSDKTFQLNPILQGSFGVRRTPMNGDLTRYEVMLKQPFEIGGQQDSRRTISHFKRKKGEDQLFSLRMKLMSRVKFLYYKGLVLKKKWEAINEVKQYFDRIVQMTRIEGEERYISDPQALLVEILYDSFMNQYDLVKEQLDNNLNELKSVIYFNNSNPIELSGNLSHRNIPFNAEELNQLAQESRLNIRMRHSDLQIKEGELQMEESKLFPEISVFVKYMEDMNNQIYDAGLSFPLPVLNTNSHNIDAKEMEKEQIRLEIAAITLEIRQEILIALRKMRFALDKIKRYKNLTLKDSKKVKNFFEEYYKEGGIDYITLLQQEKIYQETILSYWTAVLDYYQSLFDLEMAVGRVFLYQDQIENISGSSQYKKDPNS